MCAISKLSVLSVVLAILSSAVLSAAEPAGGIVTSACASDGRISFGTTNSFRGIGLSMDIGNQDFHSISVTADLTNIVNGKVSTPGMRITYHYNMTLRTGKTDAGYEYLFYAGPGIAQGYVRSLDKRKGYMAGLSGSAGAKVFLDRNISISTEFQADAALIFKNKYIHHMSLYKEGILRCLLPYIRIQYSF